MNESFINGMREWLCETLEETTDKQEQLRWFEREWDFKDWRTWMACCYGLAQYVKNNRVVLARMLRCLCDTESGGSQNIFITVCEAYCDHPYDDEVFISEVVKAAPEMLKRSANFFGGVFQDLLNHCIYDIPRQHYLSALSSLETMEEKQSIIDFLVYLTQEYPIVDGTDHEKYHKLLADSLHATGLQGGNSIFFNDYF